MNNDGGRRGRFKIRGVYYPTYRSVRAEVLKRLGKYTSKAPEDLDADDSAWFVDLIREMHPYADKKLCKPVAKVRRYNRYGVNGNNLLLMYEDGSSCPFSWNKCCKGKLSSDAHSVKAAFRDAVKDQTSSVMFDAFSEAEEIKCPCCGEMIGRDQSHVDHMPPEFADLLGAWLIDHDLTIDQITLADDPQGGARLPVGVLRDSWRFFHDRHARLRVICGPCNTSRKGGM
jgi:hypothetical protein